MKRILKVTSILGLATIVTMFSGVIRAKFLAWQLGPTGMGIIGQAMMYSVFTIQLCSLSMGTGIIKAISRNVVQKRDDKTTIIVDNSSSFQLIASVLFIAAVLPFSMPLTKFLFSDYKYWPYFVGITIVTPFAIYLIGVVGPIFYGFKKIADFTKLTVFNNLLGLCLIISLVYFFKINGALLQIMTMSVIGFFTSYYFMKRKLSITPKLELNLFKNKITSLASIHLFKYGLISFIPGNVNMVIMIYLRGIFMRDYGLEANGYFQVAYAMSAYYLPFVTNGVWGHFYPEMCALKNNKDINRELNQFIRFALLVSTAIAAVFIIFRKYVILILYSSQFLKAYDLLAVQVIGDIFFILYYIFATSLTARRKFRDVLISMVVYNGVLLLAYYILTHFTALNLLSLNMAIAFSNIILAIAAVIYWRFDTGFILSSVNTGLFIKSMCLVTVIFLMPDTNILISAAKAAIAIVWFFVSVTREEASSFTRLLFSSFRGKMVNENGR